jgi:hypothetical protein
MNKDRAQIVALRWLVLLALAGFWAVMAVFITALLATH